jgi:hypothetical protein
LRKSREQQTKVTDRGICDQFFQVGLNHRNKRAIDNPDHRKRCNVWHERQGRVGKKGKTEAYKSVCTHLQQNSGKNYASRCWSLNVRVGQPGMQREERDLDTEAERKRQENQVLRIGGNP